MGSPVMHLASRTHIKARTKIKAEGRTLDGERQLDRAALTLGKAP
jgi:hypothetical protein